MQTLELKPRPIGSLLTHAIAADISAHQMVACPDCSRPLLGQRVQVLASLKDFHLGWRRFTCVGCSHSESRLVIVRGSRFLEYQTHEIC
jgi:hypothetical protein